MRARPLREESGYSLVEVMASIMILSLAIIPMVGMFDMGLNAASRSGDYDRGRTLANEKLEEIRALPYRSPDAPEAGTANSVVEKYQPGTPVTDTPQTGFSRSVTTKFFIEATDGEIRMQTDDTPTQPMMRVTVTVSWGGSSYTTTGFVAGGLGS
jgi:hypothetical protein